MELKPGYKRTEVGAIPEGWSLQTLERVSTISRLAGAEYTSLWKETPDGEIIALRGYNIGQGKIIERDLVRISNKLSLRLKRSRLCKGDVVYPCVGSIGNAVVITEDAKYHIQQNIARITPEQCAINSNYLANYLMSSLAEREVERFTSSSSQPSVLVGSLRQYRVPLPPLPEQRAIATALSDVDALIALLDRLIAKKRDMKQAVMQELLTGKRRLPGFSGEWEVKRLVEIADILSGGTPSTSVSQFWEGDVPWCTPTDITALAGRKYLSDTSRKITFEGLKSSSAEMIPAHSIVMTSRATIGECAINTVPVSTNQGFKNFVPFEATDVEFLYYLLTTQKSGFISLCGGSTFLEIGKTQLVPYQVYLPPMKKEQTAIATILSDMDAEIAALEQKRDKTRLLKQGMMQELLTGRIRLA